MKRIISLVVTIAIILILIVTSGQPGSSAYNGNMQLLIEDSSFSTEDFPFAGSGLLIWQPYY